MDLQPLNNNLSLEALNSMGVGNNKVIKIYKKEYINVKKRVKTLKQYFKKIILCKFNCCYC